MIGLVRAAGSQMRVVYAILLRDLKIRTKDSPIGVLSAVTEPVMQILLMTAIFSYAGMRAARLGDYIMLFFMTGMLPVFCFKMTMINANITLMRHRQTMYAPFVRPLDLFGVNLLFVLMLHIALYLIFDQYFVIFEGYEGAENLVLCAIPMICNALIGFGFGVIVAVLAGLWRYTTVIFGIVTAPIQLLSGMFFTAETIPPVMRDFLWWNPFFHSTELFRTYFYPEYTSDLFDPMYYYGWVITFTAIGLATERLMRHRLLARAG